MHFIGDGAYDAAKNLLCVGALGPFLHLLGPNSAPEGILWSRPAVEARVEGRMDNKSLL